MLPPTVSPRHRADLCCRPLPAGPCAWQVVGRVQLLGSRMRGLLCPSQHVPKCRSPPHAHPHVLLWQPPHSSDPTPCSIAGASASLAISITPGSTGQRGSPLPSLQPRLPPLKGGFCFALCSYAAVPFGPRISSLGSWKWVRARVCLRSWLWCSALSVMPALPSHQEQHREGKPLARGYGAQGHRRHRPCERGGQYRGTCQTH